MLSKNKLCGVWFDPNRGMLGTYTAEGIKAIADALVRGSLTQVIAFVPHFLQAIIYLVANVCAQINLTDNCIGGYNTHEGYPDNKFIPTPEGPKAIADSIRVSGSLTAADLRYNAVDGAAKQMLRDSVKDRVGFKLQLV